MELLKTICLILSINLSAPFLSAQETRFSSRQDSLDFELLTSSYNNDLNKAVQLLKQGANVNTVSPDGITPLIYAVQNGNLDMVKLLFYNHADYSYQSNYYDSPVFMTLKFNDLTMMEFFLNKGVDPNLMGKSRKTLLYVAAENDLFTIADMLLYYKANPDLGNYYNWTPLMISTFNGHTETSKLLIENNANTNVNDFDGITPMMITATCGNDTLLKILIQKGTDLSARDKKGNSALTYAISNDKPLVTKILIESGALAFEKDQKKLRAIAAKNKNKEIIELLDKAGVAPLKLGFDENRILITGTLNFSDILNGMSFETVERKYKFGLEGGFIFRPYRKKVLKDVGDNITYQYRESKYSFYVGVHKYFMLDESTLSQSGFFAGLNTLFSWGNYAGTEHKPDKNILFAPDAGFFWNYGIMSVKTGFQYLDFGYEEFSPYRFTLSIGFRWNGQNLSKTTIRKP